MDLVNSHIRLRDKKDTVKYLFLLFIYKKIYVIILLR